MTAPIWPITSDALNDLPIPGRSWCRITADFRRSRLIAHCRFADLERGSRLELTTMGDAYLQQAMEVLLG